MFWKIFKYRNMVDLCKIFFALLTSKVMKLFIKDEIWLIGERQNQARDNGYHLFKYIRENKKNEKIYYIIKKDAKDLKKIEKMGNVIFYDTFRHYIYYFMSDKIICAHNGSVTPNSPIIWIGEEKNFFKRKKKIYIKHGIIKEEIESHKYKNNKADLFVCGAKPEYEFVKKYFGYKEGSVKYLGLCRFDNLYDFKIKRQILFMPTWRKNIKSKTWSGGSLDEACQEFVKTEYYKRCNNLINNENLIRFLEEENVEFVFYQHYETSIYKDVFDIKSKKIVLANDNEFDLQDILKSAYLLITDYSSVAFDFAYMKKDIIYYQFDEEEYYKNHYQKGYFDYVRDGFGPVYKEEVEVVNSIINYKKMRDKNLKYRERSEKFFTIHDRKNCLRHYQEIKKL